MILRFVHGTDMISRLIIAQQKTAMPFTPSHVEAITPDGFYLGAHYNSGVEERKPGYDKDWVTLDLSLTLEATKEQDDIFYSYLHSNIGKPYDWTAITGFINPGHHHDVGHVICSAFMTGALRACEWFKWPLPVPWHLVDPRDLLLMIGARMQIPM